MPTFRGEPGSEFQLFQDTGCDFAALDEALGRLDLCLDIKLHPIQVFRPQDLEALAGCRRVRALLDVDDIYSIIGRYDALVTDFSGILVDYLLSNRPIVVAPFGLDSYMRADRSLYYSLEELSPSPPQETWQGVLEMLDASLNDAAPSVRYLDRKRRFHSFDDDRSAERGLAAVREALTAHGDIS